MKSSVFAAAIGFSIALAIIFTTRTFGQAKPETKPDFSKLQIVTYASGLTGFFDADSGKLYLYDANWDQCIWIRQLTQPGEPMKKLKN